MEKISVYIGNRYYRWILTLYGVKLEYKYITYYSNYSEEKKTIDIHCGVIVSPSNCNFNLKGYYEYDKHFPPKENMYRSEDIFNIDSEKEGLGKLKIHHNRYSSNSYLILKNFPIVELPSESQDLFKKYLTLNSEKIEKTLRESREFYYSIYSFISEIIENNIFEIQCSGLRECAPDSPDSFIFRFNDSPSRILNTNKKLNIEGGAIFMIAPDSYKLIDKIYDFLFSKNNQGRFKTSFTESDKIKHRRRLYY